MDPPEVTELRRNIENLRQKISDSENNLQLHRNGMDALLDVSSQSLKKSITHFSGSLETSNSTRRKSESRSNLRIYEFE